MGQNVMIPDGREGPVVQVTGDICKVLAYGEDRMSLWAYYLLEPSDPHSGANPPPHLDKTRDEASA
ncbi:MAG: hypothetical protein HC814_08575 [Rhodobacteraceae bacterium]|nr:hypothetical protein [Paracoccaceae bacterium]